MKRRFSYAQHPPMRKKGNEPYFPDEKKEGTHRNGVERKIVYRRHYSEQFEGNQHNSTQMPRRQAFSLRAGANCD